jgi:hypothetical protein
MYRSATSPKKKNFMTAGGQPRRGSILSMWEGGKDKDGRDILAHDDHSDEEEESVGYVLPFLLFDAF